jgi:homoserine kinase
LSLATRFSRKIVVPASTSNLGPGFDTLGLAVNRYLTIEAESSPVFSLEISGEGASEIPTDESNLIIRALKKISGDVPKLRILVHNEIPSCGGFGASGAAIIGGLVLGNELLHQKHSIEDIYNIAVDIEGHPDNVSAALFGGLIVNARNTNGEYSRIRIPVNGKLKFVAVLPDSKVETAAARKILPTTVTLHDAVSNVQHSSLLVAAFATQDYELLRFAIHDELHEKHRKKLIPHFDDFESAALESGALAFAVSGAGSSCIAFSLQECEGTQNSFKNLIRKLKLDWRTEVFEPVNKGVQVLSRDR